MMKLQSIGLLTSFIPPFFFVFRLHFHHIIDMSIRNLLLVGLANVMCVRNG